MTVAGLALIVLGLLVGLINPTPYNGQWLLGLLIATAGLALVGRHTYNTKEGQK